MAYTQVVEVAWDEGKNVSNRRRRGISFEEAAGLFTSGVDYLEIFDEAHSDTEGRIIAVGPIRRASFSSCGPSGTRIRFASSAPAGRPAGSERSTFRPWSRSHDRDS